VGRARGILVLGTDTGVGKTVVTALLARALRANGQRVCAYKPVACGTVARRGRRVWADTEYLAAATAVAEERVGLYRLDAPLSPHVAAAAEPVEIDIERIVARYRELERSCETMLVEGVGGALVPLNEQHDMLDVAVALGLPAVVVARPGLGTLNHTLLTVRACRERGVDVLGVVVNGLPPRPSEAERSNLVELPRLTGVPLLGVVAQVAGLDVDAGEFGELDEHVGAIDLAALLLPPRDYASAVTADAAHVWHPFTAMREYLGEAPHPLMIVRAEGCRLEDAEGRRYIDGVSSLWTNVHGHRVRELDDAVREQLAKVAHSTLLGLANEPSALLAERLASLAPSGLTRVFYSDSGSTAVEIALKIAFQYWRQVGRPEKASFVSFTNAYHGDTIGAVSVGGIDLFHGIFGPLLFDARLVPAADCYRCPHGLAPAFCGLRCLDALYRALEAHAHEIAAVVMEPVVQGAAGMLVQPAGYVRRVADLCGAHDVLLIADEVATGFGRTGRMFACEHDDVRPDLMTVAKGITGGYLPLAATLATERIYEAFLGTYEESKQFFHGHTYTGNPLACAVALANLELIERDGLIARVGERAALLAELLAPLRRLAHVGDIRQTGMMVGVELVADARTREPYAASERVGRRVILKARERGVIIRPLGDVIVLMPPLAIAEADLRELVDVAAWAISEITEEERRGQFAAG